MSDGQIRRLRMGWPLAWLGVGLFHWSWDGILWALR